MCVLVLRLIEDTHTYTHYMDNKRYYSWSLIVYNDILEIMDAISRNKDGISHFAISPLHDKDIKEDGTLKEKHYHILITFKQNKSLNLIKKDFNLSQNIFGERLVDRWSAFEYLTHENENDKVLYNEKDIVCSDILYYTRTPSFDKEIEKNSKTLEMLEDIISGVPYRDMVIQYGKDYILNYERYLLMARLINMQENKTNDLDNQRNDIIYCKNTQ